MRRAEKHEVEAPLDPRLLDFLDALAAALVADYERSLAAKKQSQPLRVPSEEKK